jgi:2'-5' RNA ligase
MKTAATVGGDERMRLFLALELPDDVGTHLAEWGRRQLSGGRRSATFHVTLAFLGSKPRAAVDPVCATLRTECARVQPFPLEIVGYRETRAVGMLVLADPTERAALLATRVQEQLAALGVYEPERRAWLPHVTVLRFRERPGLRPTVPRIGLFVPSGAAAFLSRLHPSGAQYEVLESCPLEESGG